MKQFGVDVSRFQGAFDFGKAAAEGAKFAVLKGGGGNDGLYVDAMFEKNYAAAKKQGLPVGAYWFSGALTAAEAEKEAAFFYERCVKGRTFELPLYIDVELKRQLTIGKNLLTGAIRTWCRYLEARSCFVGIYASKSVFEAYMHDDQLQDYTHWVAQWTTRCTYPHAEVLGMWQFGGETNKIRSNKVAGVVCDQDYLLQDLPALIKAGGFNGFAKPDTGDTYSVQIGAFGKKANAEALAKKAKAAGFDAKIVIKGDLDGDGKVSAADARKALRMATGLED